MYDDDIVPGSVAAALSGVGAGGLARTGFDTMSLVVAAVALILFGVLLLRMNAKKTATP
jgi:hypothetical protein